MIDELIKMAEECDHRGHYRIASEIDAFLQEVSMNRFARVDPRWIERLLEFLRHIAGHQAGKGIEEGAVIPPWAENHFSFQGKLPAKDLTTKITAQIRDDHPLDLGQEADLEARIPADYEEGPEALEEQRPNGQELRSIIKRHYGDRLVYMGADSSGYGYDGPGFLVYLAKPEDPEHCELHLVWWDGGLRSRLIDVDAGDYSTALMREKAQKAHLLPQGHSFREPGRVNDFGEWEAADSGLNHDDIWQRWMGDRQASVQAVARALKAGATPLEFLRAAQMLEQDPEDVGDLGGEWSGPQRYPLGDIFLPQLSIPQNFESLPGGITIGGDIGDVEASGVSNTHGGVMLHGVNLVTSRPDLPQAELESIVHSIVYPAFDSVGADIFRPSVRRTASNSWQMVRNAAKRDAFTTSQEELEFARDLVARKGLNQVQQERTPATVPHTTGIQTGIGNIPLGYTKPTNSNSSRTSAEMRDWLLERMR